MKVWVIMDYFDSIVGVFESQKKATKYLEKVNRDDYYLMGDYKLNVGRDQ